MKLCWDNLDNVRLTTYENFRKIKENGQFCGKPYYLKVCINCNEEYLGEKESRFCTLSCSCSKEYSPMYGKTHTKEAKEKISKLNKGKLVGKKNPMYGRPSPMLGKHHSLKTRKKMSEIHRGKNNPFYGKTHTKESREKISAGLTGRNCGEAHHSWAGGYSKQGYCDVFFDEDYKQDIRDRDHNMCWTCGNSEKQNGKKLNVHHIDYDKLNCKPSNLLSLCDSCHGISNFDREWHTEWYQRIINKRGII